MTLPLRVALFGAGGYGANHAQILEQLQTEGLVKFVAVADPTAQTQAKLRARLELGGLRWFPDYLELLETLSGQLDAVVISTPIPLHLPMLEAVLDRQLAVFLEKPPVPLIQDFLRLAARPEAARVAVGFNLLADPNLWRLKDAMLRGTFGRIQSIRGTACWPRLDSYYGRAGWAGRMLWRDMPVFDGPATNALAHIVHNVMFLAGTTRAGFGVPGDLQGEIYRARKIESYDLCCLAGFFPQGPTFGMAFTHAVEKMVDWSIVIEGERGRATLARDGITSEVPLPAGEPACADIFAECWRDFLRFATSVRKRPLTGFLDCRGYVAVTNAMLISSGGIRDLPPGLARRFDRDGDGGVDVPGIADLIAATGRSGRTFAECGAEWAREGRVVDAGSLREIPFAQFVPQPAAGASP